MYKVPLMRPSLPDKKDFINIVDELWETRMLSNFSKYSKLFEQDSKNYFQSDRHFMSVVSCDVGLTILLKSFNLPKGSEILVPSFTFNSTPNVILWNDLKPIFVDINKETYCIDTNDLESKITNNTSGILATHIFGNPCDCEKLESIAKKHNVKLIFDAAHAYGSKYNGKSVSHYGDAGVFSFSGTKLITSAEGGMTYIKDKEIADKFYLARNYGMSGDYNTKILGMNGKISEFHSAIAYLAIKNIEKVIKRRLEIADKYKNNLKNCMFQKVNSENLSTYKDFSILINNRDKVYEELEKKGIQSKKYFFPNHYSDYYKKELGIISLPNTEEIYSKILCLPIFNDITDEQINYVIDTLNGIL